MAGVEGERTLVAGDGLIETALGQKRIGEAGVNLGRTRIAVERLAEQPGRLVEFALLEADQAEMEERSEMLAVARGNIQIKPRGFGQIAAVMQRQRLVK